MDVSPHKMDDDQVARWSAACAATLDTLTDWAALSKALRDERKLMIRIRTKPTHVTLRIGDEPKQRYASAIHALHAIRVAIKEGHASIEETPKTRAALAQCIERAEGELTAAIHDVSAPVAVCVGREGNSHSDVSYYQTADKRNLKVIQSDQNTFIDEGDRRIRAWPKRFRADDAIRSLGYVVAPGDEP